MLPYTGLAYFALALLLAVPAIVLGLRGRRPGPWILVASLLMLVVHSAGDRNRWPGGSAGDLWIVAGYVLLQWALARGLLRLRARGAAPFGFGAALAVALAPLVAVKFVAVYGPASRIGFLGISYITFRALDVLVGINDGLIKALPAGSYLSYLLFFPTASSGPIDRYRRYLGDVATARSRPEFLQDLDEGVHQLFTGLLYKFILGELVRTYWLDPVTADRSLAGVISYMYAYSAYLFFDFAGYSAIAIGIARCFGVRVPANFDRPFLATSIVEFWQRWHISLSTWFRDQIYMRVVLAATKRKWFRSKYTGSYIGYTVTFLLMGLWHGFRSYYLAYGAYQAALLIGHSLVHRWTGSRPALAASRGWRLLGWATTFNAVCFGFLIFSGHLAAGTAPAVAAPATAKSVALTPHPAPGPVTSVSARRLPR